MSETILIVDDEQDLVHTLEYNLQREGYETRTALRGEDGLEAAGQFPTPSLILLDLMLPDMSGIEICKRLRQNPETARTPIIMLTAKSEEIDRVVGFEVGADDYVSKPFSVRELLLRIRAILRRTKDEPKQEKSSEQIHFGDLKIDLPKHQVWFKDKEINLTALEFRLLTTLLKRKGRVQSRETLLNDVWGIKNEVTTRTVDTHVKRLREKLRDAGRYIETLRGVGYRFREEPTLA